MSAWQELQDRATAADIDPSDDFAWAYWWSHRAQETADRLDAVTEGLDAAKAEVFRLENLNAAMMHDRTRLVKDADQARAEVATLREGLDAAHAVGYREGAREIQAKFETAKAREHRLAETVRDSWQAEVAALEAQIEGLVAERDKYRIDAEALRARGEKLEDALRGIIKAHRLSPWNPLAGLDDRIESARALIDAAREGEKEQKA